MTPSRRATPKRPAPETPGPKASRRPRVLPETVLKSSARRALMDAIHQRPGRSRRQLSDLLDMGWGTLDHHLRILERTGHVEIIAGPHVHLVFPKGHAQTEAHKRAAFLYGTSARRVAEFILAHPGCDRADVVNASSTERRTAYYHVHRLLKHGLIRSKRPTRHAELVPADDLAALLAIARGDALVPSDSAAVPKDAGMSHPTRSDPGE
jgi:Bacterial regulatory protein, arsR family